MKETALFEKIDLHLIRVLHTVLTERNVSRAALRLGMHQPAVSAALKKLREVAGDPLLVRTGSGMVPTDAGLRMIEPSAHILRAAESLFASARAFEPASTQHVFRIAASDYIDPLFLPQLITQIKRQAPDSQVEIHPLTAEADYRKSLAQGEVDVVIGNWLSPPDDLHLGKLLEDDVVCLLSSKHPLLERAKRRVGKDAGAVCSVEEWLQAEHIAPTPMHPGALGVIDEVLMSQGLSRRVTVRSPYFGLIPAMVASSHLILTTGRRYCERFTAHLPLTVMPTPVPFPVMRYYQLWHERSHASTPARWLREQIKHTAATLGDTLGFK